MSWIKGVATAVTAAACIGAIGVSPALAGGSGHGSGGASGGTWPAQYPLPEGTLVAQSADSAAVRSTQATFTVSTTLRAIYTGLGCVEHPAVNKPLNMLCFNPATHKTDNVYFVFAALDPAPTDPSISQTTAHLLKG